MKLSKFTLFLSGYIILSSFFMQEVWNTWKVIFGVKRLILFFILLYILTVAAILYKNIKLGLNLKKIVLILAICILGFIFAWRQPYLPEKAHVLEFGLWGWLVIKDLMPQKRSRLKNILVAFILAIIMGCLEEGYQKLLPWRVFEIRDIFTDILSSILGISLFLISNPKIKNS